MTAKNAILEINGQRYEAHSGDWTAKNQASKAHARRSIDGIVSSVNIASTVDLSPHKQPLINIVAKPTMNDVVGRGVNPINKQLQPSKALMRQAVKKPDLSSTKKIKANSAVKNLPAKQPAHHVQAKLSVANMDHMRLQRASAAQKSQNVSKFNKTNSLMTIAPAAYKAPAAKAQVSMAQPVTQNNQRRTTTDIFEEALAHATGHEQPYHVVQKRGLPKQAIILITTFTMVLVIAGVFASQNMGNVKMYLAASKAGFSASLPNYQPDGYRLNKVNSGAGIVAANFLSNSDKRSYTLTQKPSQWDSQALREIFVSKNSKDFYTVDKNGQTIYIYGNHQATWVNGGVWYQLAGNGSLSDRQLVDLATSL